MKKQISCATAALLLLAFTAPMLAQQPAPAPVVSTPAQPEAPADSEKHSSDRNQPPKNAEKDKDGDKRKTGDIDHGDLTKAEDGHQPSARENKKEGDHRNTDAKLSAVMSEFERQSLQIAKATMEANAKSADYAYWQSVFAGIALVVNGFTIWLLHRTFLATRNASEAANISATAAIKAVELAGEEANAAEERFRQSRRPWLAVEVIDHNFRQWKNGGEPLEWRFRLVNYGASPAYIDSITAETGFLSPGHPMIGEADQTRRDMVRDIERTLLSSAVHIMRGDYPTTVMGVQSVEPGGVISPIVTHVGFTLNFDEKLPEQSRKLIQRIHLMAVGPNMICHVMHVLVDYHELDGTKRQTSAAFLIEGPSGAFRTCGREQYNYCK